MSLKAELARFFEGLESRVSGYLNLAPEFEAAQAKAKALLVTDLQKYVATQQAIAAAAQEQVTHTNAMILKIVGGSTLPANTQQPSTSIRIIVDEAEAVEGVVGAVKAHWRWVWPIALAAALVYIGLHWG